MAPTLVEKLDQYPSVWLGTEYSEDRQALEQYLQQFNIQIEQTDAPSADALILIATYGEDATSAAVRYQVSPQQVVCIDLLYGLNKHRTLMPTFVTKAELINAAQSIFNLDGVTASTIQESVGFVAQRALAMIVNLGCDIAQQGVATVEDINVAVKLGLVIHMAQLNGAMYWVRKNSENFRPHDCNYSVTSVTAQVLGCAAAFSSVYLLFILHID